MAVRILRTVASSPAVYYRALRTECGLSVEEAAKDTARRYGVGSPYNGDWLGKAPFRDAVLRVERELSAAEAA